MAQFDLSAIKFWAKTTKDDLPGISVLHHMMNVGLVAESLTQHYLRIYITALCESCLWEILFCISIGFAIDLKNAVGEESYGVTTAYIAFVGANLFACNSLSVRINSHLQTRQLRFLT